MEIPTLINFMLQKIAEVNGYPGEKFTLQKTIEIPHKESTLIYDIYLDELGNIYMGFKDSYSIINEEVLDSLEQFEKNPDLLSTEKSDS